MYVHNICTLDFVYNKLLGHRIRIYSCSFPRNDIMQIKICITICIYFEILNYYYYYLLFVLKIFKCNPIEVSLIRLAIDNSIDRKVLYRA